jgi:hypothetical protein
MTQSVRPASGVAQSYTRATGEDSSHVGVPWYVSSIVIAASSVVLGLIWDISWHMSVGRDGLFSPPHLLSYLGAVIVGLTCGWLAITTTLRGTEEQRARSVRVWGFRAPLGAWVAIWGACAMLTSAPFDDWWHAAYGLDVKIMSPPHVLLLIGMLSIVIGAMLMARAHENSIAHESGRSTAASWLHLYSLGLLLTMLATFATEYSWRSSQHGPLFYIASALAYTAVLVAAVRGGDSHWSATTVAATYTIIRALATWILPLFPASPKLGPVYQHVTTYVPMEFPLLLIVPALVIDLLARRVRSIRAVDADDGESTSTGDWQLAPSLALVFIVSLMIVQWPFATFLQSPAARNWIFAADRFPYMAAPQSIYVMHRFENEGLPAIVWIMGFVGAVTAGTLSARLGLAWGRWMRRVYR